MKLLLAGIIVTIFKVCSITGTDAGPIIQEDVVDWFQAGFRDSLTTGVKDFTHGKATRSLQISKAILDTWKVIDLLVRNAKHVYFDGTIAVYRKKGSYTNALEDFYSTSPVNVKDLLSPSYVREAYGELAQLHKMGVVGKRRIYIGTEKSDGSPVIAVSKVFHPETLDRLIIYRK